MIITYFKSSYHQADAIEPLTNCSAVSSLIHKSLWMFKIHSVYTNQCILNIIYFTIKTQSKTFQPVQGFSLQAYAQIQVVFFPWNNSILQTFFSGLVWPPFQIQPNPGCSKNFLMLDIDWVLLKMLSSGRVWIKKSPCLVIALYSAGRVLLFSYVFLFS